MRKSIDDRSVTQEELESGLYRRTMAPERQEKLQMKYVKFYVGIGCVGGDKYEIMELPDDATDSDIDEAYDEWRECRIDSAWWECDKAGNTI